jgi:tRNA uridine 5-carboxymethylaminomethyl modification enzyme
VPPNQTTAALESKLCPGLFFAGQINGTTGYEEAAGQGIIAGINAALASQGKPPLLLRRDQAYIGVMIDDLVTRDLEEPYRQMTSRAEFRLLLRQDNADLRLTPIAHELGLVNRERYLRVENKRDRVAEEMKRLARSYVNPTERLAAALESQDLMPLNSNITTVEFLRRQDVSYKALLALGLGDPSLSDEMQEQVEIEAKYAGYIAKQQAEVERIRKLEHWPIPQEFDYDAITALRTEAREKLKRFRPATVGQASRIMGVNPTDIGVLLVWLERGATR